jgi:hypothetical protein
LAGEAGTVEGTVVVVVVAVVAVEVGMMEAAMLVGFV